MKGFTKDGGYKSRKFWLAIIAMGILLVAGKFTPTATLPEIVAGIVALYTVYATGNVIARFNSSKLLVPVEDTAEDPTKDPTKDPGTTPKEDPKKVEDEPKD